MDSEAASEWLKTAGSTIGRIQNTYLAIGVFALTVVLTLLTQHWQLIQAQAKAQAVDTIFSHPWNKLDRLYEEFPEDYIDKQVVPWYNLSLRSVVWTTFIQGTLDPKEQNHGLSTELSQMSSALQRLRDYNADLRSVDGARKLNTSLDNLDPARLASLIRVSHFEADDAFTVGLNEIFGMAGAALKVYDANPKKFAVQGSAHNTTVTPSPTNPSMIFTPEFFEALRALPPRFTTLDSLLAIENYGEFADDELTDAERATLSDDLKSASFTSLGDLKHQRAALEADVNEATNAAVKLPVVDLAIGMPMFGTLALFLNAILLAWVASLACILRYSLNRYRQLAVTVKKDLVLAITAELPFTFGSRTIARVSNILVLCLPGALGTSYYLWLGFHSAHAWKGTQLIPPLALSTALLFLFIVGGWVTSLGFSAAERALSDPAEESSIGLATENPGPEKKERAHGNDSE